MLFVAYPIHQHLQNSPPRPPESGHLFLRLNRQLGPVVEIHLEAASNSERYFVWEEGQVAGTEVSVSPIPNWNRNWDVQRQKVPSRKALAPEDAEVIPGTSPPFLTWPCQAAPRQQEASMQVAALSGHWALAWGCAV